MLRKIMLVVLAAAMLLTLVSGCAPAAEPTDTPEPKPTAAPPPTKAPEPTKTYKVALVCGLLGDRSFLDSAARGIAWAEEQFPNVETKIIENADMGEQQLAARAMAEEGYDLIITVGFNVVDWTTEIANEYPDTHFAVVQGVALDVENGTALLFHDHEGCFTVGMAAAMMTKTGKVGFIGGMDAATLRRFHEGFLQGVAYADPNVQVVTGWVGGWADPTKGKELALTQYEEGADIIFVAAGGSGEGVLAAAAEQDLFAIGVDSDQCWIQPGHVICTMMKMVDVAVLDTITALRDGTLEGGNRYYSLAEKAVGMCYLYDTDTVFFDNGPADMVDQMKNEVIPAVKEAVSKIVAGEMCVKDHMELKPCDNPALPGGMPGAAEAKTYKVALVCGLLGDRTFVDNIALGVNTAQADFPNIETKIIENADVGEQQLAARAMAEEGYDMVITVGFGVVDWTVEIANEYPDTHFVVVDPPIEGVPNATGLIFKSHDQCFAVGVIAALMTETDKIGFVGGMDDPNLRNFQEGYWQGARYVNPDIEIFNGWVGSWSDANKAKELALTQFGDGADIIFAAAGGAGHGVHEAASDEGLFSIGVGMDQCDVQPGSVMCSALKNVNVATYDAIQKMVDGTLTGGTLAYGLEQDAVGTCWLYDTDTYFVDNGPADMVAKVPAALAKLQEAIARIKAGEFCINDYTEVFPCDNPVQPGAMND